MRAFLLFLSTFLTRPAYCASPIQSAKLIAKADALYFNGRYHAALADYRLAARLNPVSPEPWLDGAVIFSETAHPQEAAKWFARAAAISPSPDILTALGWSQLEARRIAAAQENFGRALEKNSDQSYAWLGMARSDLDLNRPRQAVRDLDNARKSDPFLNLVPYYLGRAYERLDEESAAAKALRRSVIADSYFQEARQALAQVYLRERRYNSAWREIAYILSAEPRNRFLLGLFRRIEPLLTRTPSKILGTRGPVRAPARVAALLGAAKTPLIRVGIGTDSMGNPRPRKITAFSVNENFAIENASGRRKLAAGRAEGIWEISLRRIKNRWRLDLTAPSGRNTILRSGNILIRPASLSHGVITLTDLASTGPRLSGKSLRGILEVSSWRGRLRLIDIVDVESYTAGVVAAEMPIDSPFEALKTQAVLARSEALYLKNILKPHRHEGYDLCDGQHCQVYAGVGAESARSRAAVMATRGQAAFYKNKIAQVTYSADCGGYTQSGKDVSGWGNIPYWKSVSDIPKGGSPPASPWALRQWLFSWPKAYCSPSIYVYPSHFRWTRVIPFNELGSKLNARLGIGLLRKIIILRRSPPGNVNSVRIIGARRSVTVNSEFKIRNLLALGSLRSTLFTFETDYDSEGRPKALIFHGGGWGHGVGLCQSGAIGRALTGQNYRQIIQAYFPGVRIKTLGY
ncbi:MAG: SpoIID/LytB domain-containing protein [Elusimicrobiota bacterium]